MMRFSRLFLIAVSCFSNLALAQYTPNDAPAPGASGGWRKVADDSAPAQQPAPPAPSEPAAEAGPAVAPNTGIPPQLTIKPGTFLTVRMDQGLSSDRNQAGDAFSATLVQPLVVDGIVVAQRGQTVGGRVAEVAKGGRVKGVSRLGLELTTLPLVDGQQVPLQAQVLSRKASDDVGRDAGAVATTTGLGALIGAAADGGVGAGIGAGAGAGAGLIGVLLTRGRPTIVYPETILTFRIDAPVVVSTERAPMAFRFVNPDDYQQHAEDRAEPRERDRERPGYYHGYPPPYYGWPYFYAPYSYWGWWGPRHYGYGFGATIFIGGHRHSGFRGHRRHR